MKNIFDMEGPLIGGLTKIGDCICLSVFWLVFSLPVVTLGASSAALYSAVHHCLGRGEAGVWNKFWTAFQENFKRSTLAWLIELLVLALLFVDAGVFRGIRISGGPMGKLYWLALFFMAVGLTWTAYVAAYSARFNGSVREVLRFGRILMGLHPIRALGVMLPIVAGVILMLAAPVMLIFVPAGVCWINSLILEKVFRLHMRPEDLEKEEALDELDQPKE